MEVKNDQLKYLLERTDIAFKALLREPDSRELTAAYDLAKQELDSFVTSMRQKLTDH